MANIELDPRDGGTGAMLAEAGEAPGLGRVVLAREPQRRVGPLVVEPAHRRVAHDDGREDFLEPRVMQVFALMIRNPGVILTRDDLLQSCWDGRIVGEDAITRVVSRVRRASRGIGAGIFRIETIPKVGYRLVVEPDVAAPARRTRPKLPSPAVMLGMVIMLLLATLAAVTA